jgi:hypothetical protein
VFKGKRKLYWLLFLVVVGLALTLSAANFAVRSQQAPRTVKVLQSGKDLNRNRKQPTDKQLDDAAAPIVDLASPNSSNPDENRKRKNKSYDNSQMESIEANPTSEEVSIVSESVIPDLPVAMSDLIIEGRVTDSNAFLSDDKTGIYSEFTVSVQDVFKSSASVQKHDVITTERYGGRVRFPSGQIARYKVAGQGAPAKGVTYLFFLKRKDNGNYLILTAYEMRGRQVFALDGSRFNIRGKGKSSFDKHNGQDEQEFRKNLKSALQEGNQ